MNRLLRLLLLSAPLFAALSCEKDPLQEPEVQEIAVIARTAAVSKTQIGDVQPGGYLEISWLPSDNIGVFGTGTSCFKFENTLTAAAEHGIFKGVSPQGHNPNMLSTPMSAESPILPKYL